MKPHVAIVRGKFLNKYEMQFYEPLCSEFEMTAFGSLTPYHDSFRFPVIHLPSPMDIPDFPYKMQIINRIFVDAHYLYGLENKLNGFDIVHTAETYYHYTQQCLRAKRNGGIKKVIATVLENIPHNNEGIWGRRTFKQRARNELDHIIALTQKTKHALLEEGADPSKISVISHFIDTKRFTQKIIKDSNSINILFVGRLEQYKGVFDALFAYNALMHDKELGTKDIQLTFVGDGSCKNILIQVERQLGIEKKVHHTSCSYDQMPAVYQNADIFIAPSRPISTWEEQYNTSLLEAQASGMPIVTTDTGGIKENVQDAAILCIPGDRDQLYNSLKKFVQSVHMRADFGKKARRRAESVHDITIGSKKLRDLYRHLLT